MGITVNALCPGGILTDVMNSDGRVAAEALGMEFQEFLDMMAAPSAIKRLNEVEDVSLLAVLWRQKQERVFLVHLLMLTAVRCLTKRGE